MAVSCLPVHKCVSRFSFGVLTRAFTSSDSNHIELLNSSSHFPVCIIKAMMSRADSVRNSAASHFLINPSRPLDCMVCSKGHVASIHLGNVTCAPPQPTKKKKNPYTQKPSTSVSRNIRDDSLHRRIVESDGGREKIQEVCFDILQKSSGHARGLFCTLSGPDITSRYWKFDKMGISEEINGHVRYVIQHTNDIKCCLYLLS